MTEEDPRSSVETKTPHSELDRQITKTSQQNPSDPPTPLDASNDTASDVEKQEQVEDGKTNHYVRGVKLLVVFIGLSLSMFIIILDQTILIPALPIIASDFNVIRQVGWISSSYFVTQCSTVLLWGQILAHFSQKIPLIMAIGIFELGSLIAAVSPNFVTLIVGRAVAGLGGAAIMVAAISIIAVVVELKRRPIFFGLFGIMFVLGSALGPIIGGSFTSKVTWRWCFYINLPVGGISMLAAFVCIPSIDPPKRPAKAPSKMLLFARKTLGDRPFLAEEAFFARMIGLDWIASIITLGSVVSLTLALISGGADGWSTTTVIAGFTCAGAGLIMLILWEVFVMKENGMVPLRVGKFRGIWGSAGVAFTRMISSLALMSYLPTFMQVTRHETAIKSAITTLPYACGMAIFGMMGAVVVQKSGRFKWALIAGSAVNAVGSGLLYMIHPDTAYAKIAGFQIIAAFGSGLIMQNTALSAQAEMDANGLAADIPQATALVSLIQLLGGSIGGSLGGALLANGLHSYLPADIPSETVTAILESVDTIWTLSGSEQTSVINAYARALDDVFLIGAAAGALGVVFALLTRNINIKGKKFK